MRGHPDAADVAWIEDTVGSFATSPTKGMDHVRARETWVRRRVEDAPAGRLPGLIVALFSMYEKYKAGAFSELMWTVEALYRALPERTDPAGRSLRDPRRNKALVRARRR